MSLDVDKPVQNRVLPGVAAEIGLGVNQRATIPW